MRLSGTLGRAEVKGGREAARQSFLHCNVWSVFQNPDHVFALCQPTVAFNIGRLSTVQSARASGGDKRLLHNAGEVCAPVCGRVCASVCVCVYRCRSSYEHVSVWTVRICCIYCVCECVSLCVCVCVCGGYLRMQVQGSLQ